MPARFDLASGATLLFQTLLIACGLGVLEFLIFEPVARRTAIVEWVFSKPAFLSMSPLLSQLLSFCALALIFFVSVLGVSGLVSRALAGHIGAQVPAISSLLIVLSVAALRMYRYPDQIPPVALFALLSGALIASVAACAHRSTMRPPRGSSARVSCRRTPTVGLIAILLTALVAPDAYSLLMRHALKAAPGSQPTPSIVLIVMDTVRADHLSCYGYGKETTPNLDRLAKQGLRFVNAYSAAPWTVPSHASMFTGLYPSQHATDWGHLLLDDRFTTLAENLREAGYRTAGFTENPFTSRTHGLAQGFGEYHEMWRRPLLIRTASRLSTDFLDRHNSREDAGRTLAIFKRWVRNNSASGRPFFAFINLMAAHLPNYPRPGVGWMPDHRPADLKRIEPINRVPELFYLPKYRLDDTELRIMNGFYDQELRYLDSHVGDAVAFLKAEGHIENTILIVTSDHGENFGDHGLIEHQFCLYNTLIKVPLIVSHPSRIEPQVVADNISTVELLPWLLDVVAADGEEAQVMAANSLVSAANRTSPIFAEHANAVEMLKSVLGGHDPQFDYKPFDANWRCVIDGDLKLILSSDGKQELYNINEDPLEVQNLIAKEPDVARALSLVLGRWTESVGGTGQSAAAPDVDHETQDALKALGYVR